MGLLRFRLLGADVHIQPGFWVVVALLVWTAERTIAFKVVLALTLLTTILFHELGHAIEARRRGLQPSIVIHAFGGLTTYQPVLPLQRTTAIRIALAGPIAGLLLSSLGLLALKVGPAALHHPLSPAVHRSLVEFAQINGFWSAINLIPMMPFDGGQVLVYLLGPERRVLASQISLGFGLAASAALFHFGLTVAAAVFAASSVVQFLTIRRMRSAAVPVVPSHHVERLVKQAQSALEQGDHESAMGLCRAAIAVAEAKPLKRKAAEIYAWAALGLGQLVEAHRALEWMSDGAVDPLLQAALLEADGDAERAVLCLRQAWAIGDERPQVGASLVRLLLVASRFGEAALTTIQILAHVTVDEARQVLAACREGGRPVPAAELAGAIFQRTHDVEDLMAAVECYVAAGDAQTASATLASGLRKGASVAQILEYPGWPMLSRDPRLSTLIEGSAKG